MQSFNVKTAAPQFHKAHDLIGLIEKEVLSISERVQINSEIKADVDKALKSIIVYPANLHIGWVLEEGEVKWFAERNPIEGQQQDNGERAFRNKNPHELMPRYSHIRNFFCPKAHLPLSPLELALHNAMAALYDLYFENTVLLFAVHELQLKQLLIEKMKKTLVLTEMTEKGELIKTVEHVAGMYVDRFSVADKTLQFYDLKHYGIDIHAFALEYGWEWPAGKERDEIAYYNQVTAWATAMLEPTLAKTSEVNTRLKQLEIEWSQFEEKKPVAVSYPMVTGMVDSDEAKPKPVSEDKPAMKKISSQPVSFFAKIFPGTAKPSVLKPLLVEDSNHDLEVKRKDSPVVKLILTDVDSFQPPKKARLEPPKDPQEEFALRKLADYRKEIYETPWKFGILGGEMVKNKFDNHYTRMPLHVARILKVIEDTNMTCIKRLKLIEKMAVVALNDKAHTIFNRRQAGTTAFYTKMANNNYSETLISANRVNHSSSIFKT